MTKFDRIVIPAITLALAVGGALTVGAVRWGGLASEGPELRYQLVSTFAGEAYVIDHDLTADDCVAALANEIKHNMLNGAKFSCEGTR